MIQRQQAKSVLAHHKKLHETERAYNTISKTTQDFHKHKKASKKILCHIYKNGYVCTGLDTQIKENVLFASECGIFHLLGFSSGPIFQ